jgi:hypothetical protein
VALRGGGADVVAVDNFLGKSGQTALGCLVVFLQCICSVEAIWPASCRFFPLELENAVANGGLVDRGNIVVQEKVANQIRHDDPRAISKKLRI